MIVPVHADETTLRGEELRNLIAHETVKHTVPVPRCWWRISSGLSADSL